MTRTEMRTYEGTVPVDQEWVEEHEGEWWAIQFTVDMNDLITIDGMEGMNDLADATCGVVLLDSSYRLVAVVNDNNLLMEVSGTVVNT